jgi:hypothetical protein
VGATGRTMRSAPPAPWAGFIALQERRVWLPERRGRTPPGLRELRPVLRELPGRHSEELQGYCRRVQPEPRARLGQRRADAAGLSSP